MEIEIIDKKYKWNLQDIYKNHIEFEGDLQKLSQNVEKFANFKGKLSNFDQLLQYFIFSEEFEKLLEKVNSYIMLNHDTNLQDEKFVKYNEELNLILFKLSNITSFVMPELSKIDNKILKELLKDKRFENYNLEIESIIENKIHTLTEKEETALSTVTKFSNGFSEVYEAITQNDFKFDDVKVDGKDMPLTQSSYSMFIESKDRIVRTTAYNNLYKVINQFARSVSINYINFTKMISSDMELRKYSSTFDMMFKSSKLPKSIFYSLIDNVNKHIDLEKQYFTLLKETLKIDDFGFQDVYQSIVKDYNKEWTVDEQQQIVKNALLPLGDEYQKLLDSAFENSWVDYYQNEHKKSGGYMLGVYGIHPFILLNDTAKYDSLSTLAHELGHAMHSYLSDSSQPYSKHQYEIFIAEIASTTNEILLNKYMLKTAKTDEEKLFYLNHYVQSFKSTVFRQTMFAEFEDFVFDKIEKDEILSPEILDEKYKELLEKHFAGIVKIDKNIIHEWLRIPHFYTPYYVFQYATSFITAVYIANSILNNKPNAVENYINILKSGGSDYPLNILNKYGIDLQSNYLYDYAFDDLKQALDEIEFLQHNKK